MMILPEGELSKRAGNHNIKWPELVFLASADKEPFVDVEFVTLKQHCLDRFIPEAIEHCTSANIGGNQTSLIKAYISQQTDHVTVHEFVSVHYGDLTEQISVTVGLDVDEITDETQDYGLELLAKVDKFDAGAFHEFGRGVKIVPSDLLSLLS